MDCGWQRTLACMGNLNEQGPETSSDDAIDMVSVNVNGVEIQIAKEEAQALIDVADVSTSSGQIQAETEGGSKPISVLPNDRMAGQGWDAVAETMSDNENRTGNSEVEMKPGGAMEVHRPGRAGKPDTSRPLSVLPQDRMAAKPTISFSDTDEIRRIDPTNVENWTPVYTSALDGWKFTLVPKSGGVKFVFIAFRSPNDSGMWRIWVLRPNFDREKLGHKPHLITARVNNNDIPVICGPRGEATRTLAQARLVAGKWALYTQRRLDGDPVVFSV